MRTALQRVRVGGESAVVVSEDHGIPTRTLRRYVNYSRDPANRLFYIECVSSSDKPRSWKPNTTVPMFCIEEEPHINEDEQEFWSNFVDVSALNFVDEAEAFDELFVDFF